MRTLIIDDEAHLRHHLEKMLGNVSTEIEVIGKAEDGETGLKLIKENQPDLVFLDIRMPGLSGIDVAKAIGKLESHPFIVFTTAYDEYAIQAFEQNALDYLLKPIDEDRLATACDKALSRNKQQKSQNLDITKFSHFFEQLNHSTPSYLTWIRASKGNDIHLVACNEVEAFVAEDKYTTVITTEDSYLIRMSLKELKQQLDPDQFWQIHRSTIVRVAAIQQVSKDLMGRYSVELKNNRKYTVSRSASNLFKAM